MNKTFPAELQDLRRAFHLALPAKVAALREAFRAAQAAPQTGATWQEFERLTHTLVGSGASFGLPEVSRLAQAIAVACGDKGSGRDDSASAGPVAMLLAQLDAAAARIAVEAAAAAAVPVLPQTLSAAQALQHAAALVYVVDDDFTYAEALAEQLGAAGYEAEAMDSVAAFRAAMEARAPAIIVMDMVLREGALAGAQAVQDYAHKQSVPAIFMSVRDDFEARLAAVRAGAAAYFTKPVEVARLIDSIDHGINCHPQESYRVLIVEDTESLAILYQRVLTKAGIDVRVRHTAVGGLADLESFKPDLLLLDVNLPGVSGLEFGAIVRQFDKYRHIPIVFLTGDSKIGTRSEALQLGGDDFITKPVDNDFLAESVLARCARARSQQQGVLVLRQALSRVEAFQKALDNHAIVSMADAAGKITYANKRFLDISGYRLDELLGHTHRVVKSGQHPDSFYADMWQTISSGQIWNGEIINRAKDGRPYHVISTIVPELDSAGLPLRYLSIRTDITKLREIQRELDLEAERLALAMAATETGFWEWSRQVGVVEYNDSWRTLLGFRPDQRDIVWADLTHPDDFRKNVDALRDHMDGITPVYSVECRVKNSRGEWDWVAELGRVVERDDMGRPTRIVGTTQLINTRIAMEQQEEQLQAELMQAHKMEAMGHLSAGIAHDFNNMLGAILGYAELSKELLAQLEGGTKIGKYLDEVLTAGTRAKELVAQMLAFSRLTPEGEDGEVPVTMMKPVVKEVVHLLRSSISTTIDVNYRIDDESLRTRIQPVHLHQVILNLGINARDAISGYGHIEVALGRHDGEGRCASCKQAYSGSFVEVSVKDTGSGIAAHQLDKIFDPFFTTKAVGKGTGMGLSVVHGVVHGLGGHIEVDSKPGAGTTFRVLLPLVEVGAGDTPTDAAGTFTRGRALEGVRIMVVDDEQAMGAMLQELLGLKGAEVQVFDRPQLALEQFMQAPMAIDLLITDESMPGLSGMDMSRQMLNERAGLPIILCTGYSERATAETARQAGIAAFFNKPIDINQLVEKAAQIVREETLS